MPWFAVEHLPPANIKYHQYAENGSAYKAHDRQEILFQRTHDDILKNPVDFYKCEYGQNNDCQNGPNDMPAQGFKVLNK